MGAENLEKKDEDGRRSRDGIWYGSNPFANEKLRDSNFVPMRAHERERPAMLSERKKNPKNFQRNSESEMKNFRNLCFDYTIGMVLKIPKIGL